MLTFEKRIAELDQKREQRQTLSLPVLDDLKSWLVTNSRHILKGSLTWKTIQHALNQCGYLIGYCKDG